MVDTTVYFIFASIDPLPPHHSFPIKSSNLSSTELTHFIACKPLWPFTNSPIFPLLILEISNFRPKFELGLSELKVSIAKHDFPVQKFKWVLAILQVYICIQVFNVYKFEMSRHLAEMARCSEEMDVAIEKLQQNFQELRNNLEKAFLEQGRALLRFEAQWKDLKTGHTRDLEQRDLQLEQRGISVPQIWKQYFPTANQNANPNPTLLSNSSTPRPRWSETNTPLPLPLPPRDSTTKFFCDLCKIFCDTKMVLDKHKMGKKHQMNMGKMKGKTVGGQTSKKKADSPPEDDLQTKKRRVIEGGVSPHSLRTCTICNVVSISPAEFYKHLSGQRHKEAAAMISSNAVGTSSYGQLRIRN